MLLDKAVEQQQLILRWSRNHKTLVSSCCHIFAWADPKHNRDPREHGETSQLVSPHANGGTCLAWEHLLTLPLALGKCQLTALADGFAADGETPGCPIACAAGPKRSQQQWPTQTGLAAG